MKELLTNANFWFAICVLVIIVIALAIIKNYLKKLAYGQNSSVVTDHEEAVDVTDKDKNSYPYELTLTVDGMNCAKCATRIENMLNRQEGVLAQADVYTRKVTIRFQNKADADRFCHQVEAIHPYRVVKIVESRRNI